MVYCCVPLCTSKYDKGNETSFHEFPSDPALRRTWLKFLSREGEKTSTCWLPNDKSVVCSNHFQGKDYKPGLKRRILNQSAVPTVFCDYPHKKVEQNKLRQPIKIFEVPVIKTNPIATATTSSRPTSVDNDATAKMDDCVGLKKRIISKPNIIAATTRSTFADNDGTAKMDARIGLKVRIVSKTNIAATNSSTFVDNDGTGGVDACLGLKRRILNKGAVPTVFCEDPHQKVKQIKLRWPIKKFQVPVSKMNTAATTSSTSVDGTAKMDACVGTIMTISDLENSVKKYRAVQRQCLRHKNKCALYNVSLTKLRAENKLLKQRIENFNVDAIEEACQSGDSKANFLREQLLVFSKQKMRGWSDNTVEQCVLWNSKSPNAYRFVKTLNILTLPGRSTLRRYIQSVLGNKTSLLVG